MGQAIRTNKINVKCDKEAFTSEYSIVSYCSDGTNRNLSYEKLSNIPCLSVAGIMAKFDGRETPSERFFVLVKKGKESAVRDRLRKDDSIRSKFEDLRNFDDKLRSRIIASLAINALGMGGGPLLVCDNKNFLIPKSRKERVCLKIEVDEYLNLMTETTSFHHPRNKKELEDHNDHAFSEGIGKNWQKGPSQLFVIKDWRKCGLPLEEIYIQGKYYPDNKNTVAYWAYREEDVTHGKLHYMDLVVDSVNEKFNGIVELSFEHRDAILRDAIKTGKDTTALLHETFSGKSVYFEDPFKTKGSKAIIKQFKEQTKKLMGKKFMTFARKQSDENMVIRICEPERDNKIGTCYSKSIDRMARGVIQHITYSGNKKEDKITKESARRILVDLFIKDCNDKKSMPSQLVPPIEGWTFYNYKIREDVFVNGCSLKVDKDDRMKFENFGLTQKSPGEDFMTFAQQHLKYNGIGKIRKGGDYKVLEKDGNVYLIIDTKEIPILNFPRISGEGYDRVAKGNPLSFFKNKEEKDKYLEGYVEFHAWKSDGIDVKSEGGYSYISGMNAENVRIIRGAKMIKMWRARMVLPLHADHPEKIDDHFVEIKDMLKFGFGRWNEMMTYPFPFKFIKEYLDDVCETVFSKHWSSLT